MVYILYCDLCVISQSAVPLLISLYFASKEPGCFLEQWVQASRSSFKLSFGHCLLLVQTFVQKRGISQHSVQCVIKKL